MKQENFLIIKCGELILKAGNRKMFEDRLMENIRSSLRGLPISGIKRDFGRVTIEFADMGLAQSLKDRISRVFGIAGFAVAVCARSNPADIESAVVRELDERQISKFAVRAKRTDKTLPFSSQEINEKIGTAILKRFAGSQVDLSNPEVIINIDIHSDGAFIYTDKQKGAGGLPVGCSGSVMALISGGIDSPVAAWRMMRRGCHTSFVHFHSAPFTDAASQEKVKEIVHALSAWHGSPVRLVMVPLGAVQRKVVTSAPEKYRVILYRRFMLRIAEVLAKEVKAEALVTGEALGQVASQTLSNMTTTESAATIPIMRPLIGMDKQEIVDTARQIGTFELSIQPHQDCCQFLEPRHPATYTTPDELNDVEKGMDIEALVKEGLTGAEWMDISVGTL